MLKIELFNSYTSTPSRKCGWLKEGRTVGVGAWTSELCLAGLLRRRSALALPLPLTAASRAHGGRKVLGPQRKGEADLVSVVLQGQRRHGDGLLGRWRRLARTCGCGALGLPADGGRTHWCTPGHDDAPKGARTLLRMSAAMNATSALRVSPPGKTCKGQESAHRDVLNASVPTTPNAASCIAGFARVRLNRAGAGPTMPGSSVPGLCAPPGPSRSWIKPLSSSLSPPLPLPLPRA